MFTSELQRKYSDRQLIPNNCKERLAIECRKTNTIVIILAKHKLSSSDVEKSSEQLVTITKFFSERFRFRKWVWYSMYLCYFMKKVKQLLLFIHGLCLKLEAA